MKFFYNEANDYHFLDPTLGKDNDKEDFSSNTKVKQENDRNEKTGSKRQRRQKTHDISKDEDKKVILSFLFYFFYFSSLMKLDYFSSC